MQKQIVKKIATENPMLRAALSYAQRGWPVLPIWWVVDGECQCPEAKACLKSGSKPKKCKPAKHPIGNLAPKGLNSASIDEDLIKQWWRDYPRANIAIATGGVLFVIDVDGHEGRESLERLQVEYGVLPPTLSAISGRIDGGEHLYFTKHPSIRLGNSAPDTWKHVDVRGDGGYIIAPPSIHYTGRQYQFTDETTDIQDLPETWLKELADKKHQKKAGGIKHSVSRLRRSDPADDGQRNQKLVEYAGELERKNLSYDEILDRLRQANARYNPPETDEWVVARADATLNWRQERVDELDKLYEQLKTAKQADRIMLIQDPKAKEALRLCEATDPARWFAIRTELFKGCVTDLKKAVKTHPVPTLAPPSGVKILKDVPGCPNVYPGSFDGFPIVDGYFFQQTDRGVGLFYHASEDRQDEVSHTPVAITKRLVQADKSTFLKAEWLQQGRWKHTTAPRADFFNSNKIIELANDGFPVGSDNSKPLARYLREFEATHFDIIPEQKISFQNGWVGNSFLLGKECLSADGTVIEFQAQSDGEAAAIGALKTDGTYEKWVDGVKAVSHVPLPMISLYASLGTTLIKVVQGPSFIIDFSALSSTGKTTLLRLAASVWGQPNEAISPSITRTWNTTSVAAENLSSLLSDMPLILDDTKQAVNPEKIIKFILYGIAGGQGRSRGSKTGLRENKSMRTILLSCGESPLDTYRKDGGVRARTLLFTSYPFGAVDERTEKIVKTLKAVVFDNYGFAGPMFVRWLIDNIDRWPEFKRRYNEIRNKFANNGGIIGRLSEYAALISIAGKLAHEALTLPWEFVDPMIKIWPQLVAGAQDADVCDRGAMALYDYAVSHPSEFYNKLDDNQDAKNPKTKWSGRWDKPLTTDEWTHIDFIKSAMNIICIKDGFENSSEITNGLVAKKMGMETRTRIGDNPVRVFRIYRAGLLGDQSGSCEQCALNDEGCEKEPCEWITLAARCLKFIPKVGG